MKTLAGRALPFVKSQAGVSILFGTKVGCGLLTIALAARWLDEAGFVFFVQFGLLAGLCNLLAAGGLTHGVVRKVAVTPPEDRLTVVGTATSMAFAIGALGILASLAFGSALSGLLVGSGRWSWVVLCITALAAISGPGQIFGAYLTGVRRANDNMAVQTIALLVGTAGTVTALYARNPAAASLAFAAGIALQTPLAVAVIFWRKLDRPALFLSFSGTEFRELLRFGGAFMLSASALPAVLFLMRDGYREYFGIGALAGWLAANRLSDVFTQFIGLYMAQLYLPEQAASSGEPARSRRVYLRHWAIVTAFMASGFIIFLIAPTFWIGVAFGDKLLPYVGIITLYLFGDVLRGWSVLNLSSMLSRARTNFYMALELTNVGVFVLANLLLLSLFAELTPAIAYIGTNIVLGLIGCTIFARQEAWARRT